MKYGRNFGKINMSPTKISDYLHHPLLDELNSVLPIFLQQVMGGPHLQYKLSVKSCKFLICQ